MTTATRPVAVPDIPTVADFFPGNEASNWYGVGAPKNATAEIIDKLNREIKCGTYCSQDKTARLVDLGEMVIAGRPAILAKFHR